MKKLCSIFLISLLLVAAPAVSQTVQPGGSGGGAPTGVAGGDLSGTYPNPTLGKIGGLAVAGPTAWTPTDGSGAALAFTGVSANYVRLGNMVFAYATVTYPGTANGSNASISGFPIAAANAGYAQQCSISWSNVATLFRMQIIQNTSGAAFYNASGIGITNATMSGLTVTFTCMYPAT